jgi:hypothetical protein
MLKDSGGFAPYAGALAADGTPQMIGLQPEEGPGDPATAIEAAKRGLRQIHETQGLRAAAYFYDGRITDARGAKSDCIIGHVETVDGLALQYLQTYKIGFLKKVKLDQPVLMPGDPHIFT